MTLSTKYHIVFVMGGPGSGHEHYIRSILELYDFTHIDAASLSPQALDDNYDFLAIPAVELLKLLHDEVQRLRVSGKSHFLIHNILNNAAVWEQWPDIFHEPCVHSVLFFDCPEKFRRLRLLHSHGPHNNARERALAYFMCETMAVVETLHNQGLLVCTGRSNVYLQSSCVGVHRCRPRR
jgi:hypothetical protein